MKHYENYAEIKSATIDKFNEIMSSLPSLTGVSEKQIKFEEDIRRQIVMKYASALVIAESDELTASSHKVQAMWLENKIKFFKAAKTAREVLDNRWSQKKERNKKNKQTQHNYTTADYRHKF